MALFFSLLPIYLFGNLHCFGMCGPLVAMIGQHRHRYFYFLGRLFSFSLAGMVAGEVGAVLQLTLQPYHMSAITSFIFGGIILYIGCSLLWGSPIAFPGWLIRPLNKINRNLSLLMLKDQGWSTFLFGFFTLFLPCGQSLVVFSACALSGDAYIGLFNGFAFALLTTPSLALAMHSHLLFKKLKKHHNRVLGLCSLFIGLLALCRGCADLGLIPHWVLNPSSPTHYHMVIF